MLSSLDNSLFYLINKSWSNKFFNMFMPTFSDFGCWQFLTIIGVTLLFFWGKKQRKYAFYLLLGLFISTVVVYLLKTWTARPRPFMVLPNINLFIAMKEASFSFPSRHAVNAFMAVTLLSMLHKKFYYLYFLAAIVAFSRVYVGVHYPSDVIAGALIGVILGYCILRIDKLIFTENL